MRHRFWIRPLLTLILGTVVLGTADPHYAACAADGQVPAAGAAATPTAGAATTAPTVVNKSEGNALRMDVQNAVANYVNKAREATFNTAWNVLPESAELTTLAVSVAPIDIDISNSELSADLTKDNPGDWVTRITRKRNLKELEALTGALGLNYPPKAKPTVEDLVEDLKKIRTPKLPNEYATALMNPAVGGLTNDERIAGLLDHYALRAIMRSPGVGFRVTVSGAPVQGGPERRYDREIHWKIRLYPIRRGDFTVYRAAISAQLRPQTLTFPFASQTSATLDMTAAFKPGSTTSSLPINVSSGTGTVQFSAPPADPITPPTVNSGTTVEGILSFVGGVQLQDVVSKQLFNPNNQGRLFYGGLVGQGEIKQLVGVNQLFSSSSSSIALGILMGMAPASNNALFLGPSLQMDALTLSVGAMALENPRGTNSIDQTITVKPAIALSLDLSNLIGGKQNVQTIPLASGLIGGPSSDKTAADYFTSVVEIDLSKLSPEDQKAVVGKAVALRRIGTFDATGTYVALDTSKQNTFAFSLKANPTGSDSNKWFTLLPRGQYQVDKGSLPKEFGVFSLFSDKPVAPAATPTLFPIGQSGNAEIATISYEIRRLPSPP